jgi:hypothetical protein
MMTVVVMELRSSLHAAAQAAKDLQVSAQTLYARFAAQRPALFAH